MSQIGHLFSNWPYASFNYFDPMAWFHLNYCFINTNLYAFILFMELPDIFVTVNLFWKRYYSAVMKSSPKTNCKFAIQFFLFF